MAAANSTYKKLAVRWLIEVLGFVSSFLVADSLALRNRQLLVAANRLCNMLKKPTRKIGTFGFCQHAKPTQKNQKS